MTDGAGTFVFADIAGFTALTEAHGDEEALKLVEEFSDAVGAERVRSVPSRLAGAISSSSAAPILLSSLRVHAVLRARSSP
jgi:hypothetical protein